MDRWSWCRSPNTRELFEVNLIDLLAATKAFLPLLRKAKGRVVNIGSLAGILAPPGANSYAASRCAVQAITDSLRLEQHFKGGTAIKVCHKGAARFGHRLLSIT